jgi:hypothetical protein
VNEDDDDKSEDEMPDVPSMPELGPKDGLAVLRAKLEQFKMDMPILADIYWAAYASLREVGFSEAQATYLAAAQVLQTPGTFGTS